MRARELGLHPLWRDLDFVAAVQAPQAASLIDFYNDVVDFSKDTLKFQQEKCSLLERLKEAVSQGMPTMPSTLIMAGSWFMYRASCRENCCGGPGEGFGGRSLRLHQSPIGSEGLVQRGAG